MSATPAQIAANQENATHSTGPRTPEGKLASSRNATKFGLFSADAFVLPHEQPEFDALSSAFWTELQPQGALEETHALEIIRAAWRLQRCGKIEASLADSLFDGSLDDPAIDRKQAIVDRARAQANNTLRRATAELRALQTNREITTELFGTTPDVNPLATRKEVIATLHANAKAEKTVRHLQGIDDLAGLLDYTDKQRTQDFLRSQAAEPAAA